jgi:hypothetical protein
MTTWSSSLIEKPESSPAIKASTQNAMPCFVEVCIQKHLHYRN